MIGILNGLKTKRPFHLEMIGHIGRYTQGSVSNSLQYAVATENVFCQTGTLPGLPINLLIPDGEISALLIVPRSRGETLTGNEGADVSLAITAGRNLKRSALEIGSGDAFTDDIKRGNRVVMIGNSLPRQCGIATFTNDLGNALKIEQQEQATSVGHPFEISVVAMNDGHDYDYPTNVALSIEQTNLDAYFLAAQQINALKPDVVCVQHEYGIFGGAAGSYLLTLLRGLNAPVVTTLHTILEKPSPEEQAVLEELAVLSSALVVMSQRALSILERQGVPREKLRFIPHGSPKIEADPETEKQRLDIGERPMILTFGLMGRGKGLEQAIRALPMVVRTHPEALYLILGATHPHVLKHEGERYREELWALARELGVEGNLRMDNRFVTQEDLERYLAAADIYLTPYPNPAQITSGTLAYAVGNGKAVVSTPYWYAEELLAEGRGLLVPFHDPQPMAQAITGLLDDPQSRRELGHRAGVFGEAMQWPRVAAAYLEVLGSAAAYWESRVLRGISPVPEKRKKSERFPQPAADFGHLAAMTDSTGLFQHATGAVPNPHEGYTTDDNARALQLLCGQPASVQTDRLARTYLAFMHYALDETTGLFRNFLSYDRRWLELVGAENAQARAVRALVVAARSLDSGLSDTARELLRRQSAALNLESPRAQAIALLAAAEAYGSPVLCAESGPLMEAAARYAANLSRIHAESHQPGWDWFEGYLSYANAELPHGLIAYGQASGDQALLNLGLRTLDWLSEVQRIPGRLLGGKLHRSELHSSELRGGGPRMHDQFWPVGCDRVYVRGEARPFWDGQPIEASVTVSACVAAAAQPERRGLWLSRAQSALDWLLGDNALRQPLLNRQTGGCHDGLHRDRLSINQGAESTVLLWQAVQDLRRAEDLSMPVNLSAD
jgi:glycosyltransferase involved in cell wall biosynthesis